MGVAAHDRGSACISRGLRADAGPADPRPFAEDHALRREIVRLERRLARAAASLRSVQGMLTLERTASASSAEAIDSVYAQARESGAGVDAMYWLTLARCRAESAREWK